MSLAKVSTFFETSYAQLYVDLRMQTRFVAYIGDNSTSKAA